MKKLGLVFIAISTLLPTLSLYGCGDDTKLAESPEKEKLRAENGAKLRAIFDKCNGNYDTLSQEDKDAAIKISGSEENVKKAFGYMVPNKGTGAPSGQPPSGPPSAPPGR